VIAWLLALALASEPPAVADAVADETLIYYNARMALREGDADEAVKLWLLRNALASQTGRVSMHDPDFRTVAWAALGELSVCPDGLVADDDGVGLWPLAVFNWYARTMNQRAKPQLPRPFDGFKVGQQQRFVAIHDVLSARELSGVSLFRGPCLQARLAALAADVPIAKPLVDREVQTRILAHLLRVGLRTVDDQRVVGRSVLLARRFDLALREAELVARRAAREAREAARTGRALGMPRDTVAAMAGDHDPYPFGPDSEAADILWGAREWSTAEWMALEAERRRFVFDHARGYTGDPAPFDAHAEAIIDRLVADRDGAEVERWLARRAPDPTDRQAVASIVHGARGEALLALDDDSGFRERGVIALHRGVHQLQTGDLAASLRSLALALQEAPRSRDSQAVAGLSRRWLSYVAAQFTLGDELLVTLQELLPRREYSLLLEDLLWRAALHADAPSFARGLEHQSSRGALARRAERLAALADGDLGRFFRETDEGLRDSPSETLRFLEQLVERLEREEAGVREAHVGTLQGLSRALDPLVDPSARGRVARVAAELQGRIGAILEGLDARLGGPRDRARALAPGSEVFAGSVRLAPSDTLPWPFPLDSPGAPSPYAPLELRPIEWRGPDGELVFGWMIRG
jgi:hypothetical protein